MNERWVGRSGTSRSSASVSESARVATGRRRHLRPHGVDRLAERADVRPVGEHLVHPVDERPGDGHLAEAEVGAGHLDPRLDREPRDRPGEVRHDPGEVGEVRPRPDVVAAMDHRPGGDREGERGHRVVVQARRDHDRASLGRVALGGGPVAAVDGQQRELGQRDRPGRLGIQALSGLGRGREGRPGRGDVSDELLADARDDEGERPERAPLGLELHG